MPGGFGVNTRRKILPLQSTITYPAGGGTYGPLTLPKTGLLARMFLALRSTIGGTVNTPNALGQAVALTRVRLQANSGIDLFNVSGAGYHYLLRNMLESEYIDPLGQSSGTTAVSATTSNIDVIIPVALNMRDTTGLIMLQNEQTIVNLFIDWASPTTIGGSTATYALNTGDLYLEVFTVPPSSQDWPPLNLLHQILEDQQTPGGTGDFPYYWPRGNTYLQVLHGLGIAAAGADNFSKYAIRVNQSDYLQSTAIDYLDMEYRLHTGRARPAGGVFVDLLGSSGLGCYGLTRDMFNSA